MFETLWRFRLAFLKTSCPTCFLPGRVELNCLTGSRLFSSTPERSKMAYQHGTIKGDDAAVTSLYGERTALTSCAYFLPHVTKSANILDVGCGPGIITA